jgi:hypothetical protein
MGLRGPPSDPRFASEALIGGRFRIETALGAGSMGAVYRARDERNGRAVALKVLRPSPDKAADLARAQFQHEYHTLSQLAHPSIIEVYDYGLEQETPFYTMELLDGHDLHDCDRLGWREACSVLLGLASSLAILHSRRLLHRDVSARNVRMTRHGRVKLIDFGAMVPMGVATQVVGTAPFVPPEALQLQALDGRADLYALGALAYFVLTGRHAYPAQSVRQLRDLWRSPPPNPRTYQPELPATLARLILDLLQLDRNGRPRSAAEVMERLSAIAGLPLLELPDVQRAYLVTPTLIGRDQELGKIRAALVRAMHGRGQSILVSGAPGTGRSRLLDAGVLEAKLLGTTVLRADASDSALGEYSLARVLCGRLRAELPTEANHAAHAWRDELGWLMPEFAPDRPLQAELGHSPRLAPERSQLQSALRNWISLVARSKRLLIAIDDLDAVDEPSAALLGALAHGSRRCKLVLLLTCGSAQAPNAALALLREVAQPIELESLSPVQSEALVASVFDDDGHLAGVAQRVQRAAAGNPRAMMALCDDLVERGIVRYEAGSWSLRHATATDDLLPSLGAVLEGRLAALPPDALALAEALALTDTAALPVDGYGSLTEHGDLGRVYRAIDALLASGLLVAAGDRFRFALPELSRVLEARLREPRARDLHARLAAVLTTQNSLQAARHLMLSGQEQAAAPRLLALADDPRLSHSHLLADLLDHALLSADRLELASRLRMELRQRLLLTAANLGQYERFVRHLDPLLSHLDQQSGLSELRAQQSERGAQASLTLVMNDTRQRYEQTPEPERTFSPRQAIVHLCRLASATVGLVSIAQDLPLLERLPSLEPLYPLGPAVKVIQMLVNVQRDMQTGRYENARLSSLALLELLERSEHGGVDLEAVRSLGLGQRYMQGLLAAVSGKAQALDWMRELEQVPGHRVNAWRVRMTYELMHGNLEAAQSSRRRAELLHLQDSGTPVLPGTTARVELLVHIYADDLIGVKRSMERIEGLAAIYPRWRSTLAIARSHYLRLQGDPGAALAALEPAILATAPGRHFDWSLVAGARLELLSLLGRAEEAVALGLASIDACGREGLSNAHALWRLLAEALLRAGDVERARQFADACIAEFRRAEMGGLQLGLAYETRARVAIALGDTHGVNHFAELCAEAYQGHGNPTLSAKYQRLLSEAVERGMRLDPGLTEQSAPAPRLTDAARAASQRLLACLGPEARANEGLQLVLELTGADTGYLFAVRPERCELIAATAGLEPATAILETFTPRLRREFQTEIVTTLDTAVLPSDPTERWTDSGGRDFEPLLLFGHRGGRLVVTGLAALHYRTPRRPALRRDVLEMLADTLLM